MRKKLYLVSFIFVFILTLLILYSFILDGMARFLIVQDKLEPAEVIVVLGGDGTGERVVRAVELFKEGQANKLLMTGGALAWQLTSAEWMKKQAIALGVPAKAVLIEDASESTLEDAKFSLAIIKRHGFKRVILVTSPTHSRRAARVFKKVFNRQQIRVISQPVSLEKSRFTLSRWWTRHEDTQAVVWEYVTLIFYILKGY